MISKLVLTLLSIVILCMPHNVVFVSAEIRCIKKEREALLEFKRGVVDETGMLSSWGSEDEKRECCNWYGVRCSNVTGHVIHLQIGPESSFVLPQTPLRGKISPALLELRYLSYLNLRFNDFQGNRIPEFMGSMKMLRHLNLADCKLFGIVPQELGNLTNLVSLDLSSNNLQFENLNWLSHLSSLSFLDLRETNISDTNWPKAVLKLHSLKELNMRICGLTDGTLSKDMLVNSSSASLSHIDLSYNYLSIATLDWLFNIRSLVEVSIPANLLDGQIPISIKNLTFLENLDLSDNKLKGKFSESLENFRNLNSLNLSHNDLKGPLVESIGNLSCKALEYLYLQDNQFSGSVPDFRSCLMLRVLHLGNNKLERLPPTFAQLSEIKVLDVSSNNLGGIISQPTFMKLHNLKKLNLSFNLALHISPNWDPPFSLNFLFLRYVKLGPQFPSWIQVQKNLSALDISYTGISAKLPNWLWNFSTSLASVELSNNKIHGNIPDIYSAGELSVVDVSSNGISDPFPLFHTDKRSQIILQLSHNGFSGSLTSACNISNNLILLDVSYNQISGELPNCWRNTSNLRVLNLSNNNFSGKIPNSLGSLLYLKALHLNNNSFFGELPSTLKNCRFLKLIDVGGNELTQNIPKWIGSSTLESMKFLIFRQNRFHGNIPPEICNLTGIQVLDLSQNHLSGEVPRCLNSFVPLIENKIAESGIITLRYFRRRNEWTDLLYFQTYDEYAYISIQWKMRESKYQKILGLLKLIDLSSNKLIGNIPQELFHLKGLLSLNLSRNNLEGTIHPNIGHMKMLESLDLSRNHFSGPIPASLAQLNYLQILDLSHNNLQGKIPTGTQLQSFNKSSYDENPQLCGQPLALCPTDDLSLPASFPSENHERNWFMSLSSVEDLCISMAFGFIFGFWGLLGSLILKRSWRIAYFNFFSSIGDLIYIKIYGFLAKFRSH